MAAREIKQNDNARVRQRETDSGMFCVQTKKSAFFTPFEVCSGRNEQKKQKTNRDPM